jgi:hypothetical protein
MDERKIYMCELLEISPLVRLRTNAFTKVKTPLTKSQVLRKLIEIINLLIVEVVFTILSFKK